MRINVKLLMWPVALLLLLSACRASKARIESRYVEARNAYYSGLFENNLTGALKRVTALLQRRPDDLSARMLRAQIYLQQYRQARLGNRPYREALQNCILDLQIADDYPVPRGSVESWVRPRVYTTIGDILLIEGVRLGEQEEEDAAWAAYGAFDAAGRFFAASYQLAVSLPGRDTIAALDKERENAAGGYVQSLNGQISAITKMFELTNSLLMAEQDSLVRLARRVLTGEDKDIPDFPLRLLRIDPSFHKDAASLARLENNNYFSSILQLCEANARDNDEQLRALWRQVRNNFKTAAFHDATAKVLSGEAPKAGTPRRLKRAYQRYGDSLCPGQ